MKKLVAPYSFYYGVSVMLLSVALITEIFHLNAAVVLSLFALLATLYGMELQRAREDQSNARKLALWACAVIISGLVFAPVL